MERSRETAREAKPRPFLGIWYECCQVYGRIYKNRAGTFYTGHCPRCMSPLRVRIGAEGTGGRFFRAR